MLSLGAGTTDELGTTRRMIAVDLVVEIRGLDKHIDTITNRLKTQIAATGTTLTSITGVGGFTTRRILARTGDIGRSHYVSLCGRSLGSTARGDFGRPDPAPVVSGGNRQFNNTPHAVVITVFYDRKGAAGKKKKEAPRALKRRLPALVYGT